MKTILITGGAGFMGSNFVRYLFSRYPQYKIIVLDALTYAGNLENISPEIVESERFEFWYGNVKNGELVDTLVSRAEAVFHFAAETHVTRSIFDNACFFETDVIGTQVVANAVLKYFRKVEKFVHISTSEVYGTAQKEVMDEKHPLLPMSPYASAKCGADRLVYSYYQTYDLPVIIVRPFNNYGPYQHLEKAIPRFITSCLLNEPVTIHGDGSAQRDWLYVEDLCQALDKILHCPFDKIKGEVINIGTGRSIDILTIAKIIIQKMGKSEELITYIDDRPGQVLRHASSREKAKRLLGWEPKVKFEEGIEKTISWYQKNENWWRKLLWMRRVPIVTKEGKRVYH